MDEVSFGPLDSAGYSCAEAEESVRGNRHWWDREAASYLAEHGGLLGRDAFVWGPEGLREEDAGLLGAVRGLDVLEVGCGAGNLACALDAAGYRVLAIDPEAPEGAIFRRIRVEELDVAERVDAAIAVRPRASSSSRQTSKPASEVMRAPSKSSLMRRLKATRSGGSLASPIAFAISRAAA